jgi:hypothetical protein
MDGLLAVLARRVGLKADLQPSWMAEVRSAKPSVHEASFTGQTQEQLFRLRV